MLHILTQKPAGIDLYDALVSGLEFEFKTPDVELLAAHFLDAERDDFHWESRLSERHLGVYDSVDDEPGELDRVAIIGHLKGRWHTAICIVDGEGCLFDMLNLQHHESAWDARKSYVTLR